MPHCSISATASSAWREADSRSPAAQAAIATKASTGPSATAEPDAATVPTYGAIWAYTRSPSSGSSTHKAVSAAAASNSIEYQSAAPASSSGWAFRKSRAASGWPSRTISWHSSDVIGSEVLSCVDRNAGSRAPTSPPHSSSDSAAPNSASSSWNSTTR